MLLFPNRRTSTHLRGALQSIIQSGVQAVFFIITQQDTSVLDMFLSMIYSQNISYTSIYVILSDDVCRFEEMLFDAMDHPYVRDLHIMILNLPNTLALFD